MISKAYTPIAELCCDIILENAGPGSPQALSASGIQMSQNKDGPRRQLPPIVHIVLSQIVRLRSEGALSDAEVENKVTRLIREELDPRGFTLLRRELPGGRLRFLVKAAATGTVCDMIEAPLPSMAHAV
jgi:hypothetical protein